MKTCRCGTTGEENFYRSAREKDGFTFYCKTCIAKQRKATYWRKYPEGKGKIGAKPGNKNAQKHGRYSEQYKKRVERPSKKSTPTFIDSLLRQKWSLAALPER
jgi:hypothetical protein